MKSQIIEQIFDVISDRKNANINDSYVASLFHKGTEKIAQKVGEEATETVIEAIKGNKEKLTAESADLLFHLMVLWVDQGLSPDDVFQELESRFGTSGHVEKANRNKTD